jgi:hypothetical protein
VVDNVVVEVLGGDGSLDDLLLDLLAELLGGDVLGVLGGDDNSVDALGDDSTVVLGVLDSDLGLGVGPQPGQGAVTASLGHGSVQLVGEEVAEGKELGSLVGGIAEHDALVTGTELLNGLLVVETLSNIGGLLLNGDEQVARLVIEPLGGVVIPNVFDAVTDHLLVVEVGAGGDLAEDHDHARLSSGLASHLREGVLLQACIEDCVGDLIGNLVRVALADGLGLRWCILAKALSSFFF